MGAPLFEGAVADEATQYVGVPVHPGGVIGVQIAWRDDVSAAAITLEVTDTDAVTADAGTWEWGDSGEEITGPDGSAVGSAFLHLENVRVRRARLKIVASADCDFVIYDGVHLR